MINVNEIKQSFKNQSNVDNLLKPLQSRMNELTVTMAKAKSEFADAVSMVKTFGGNVDGYVKPRNGNGKNGTNQNITYNTQSRIATFQRSDAPGKTFTVKFDGAGKCTNRNEITTQLKALGINGASNRVADNVIYHIQTEYVKKNA